MDSQAIFNIPSPLPETEHRPESSVPLGPPASTLGPTNLPPVPMLRTYSTLPPVSTYQKPQTYSTLALRPPDPPPAVEAAPTPVEEAAKLTKEDPRVEIATKAAEFAAKISDDHFEAIQRSREIDAQSIRDNAETVHSIDTKGVAGLESAKEDYEKKHAQLVALQDEEASGLDSTQIGGHFDQFKHIIKNWGVTDWTFGLAKKLGGSDLPVETEAERGARERKEAIVHAKVADAEAKKNYEQKLKQAATSKDSEEQKAAQQLAPGKKPGEGKTEDSKHGDETRALEYLTAVMQRCCEAKEKRSCDTKPTKENAEKSGGDAKPAQVATAKSSSEAQPAKAGAEAGGKTPEPRRTRGFASVIDARTGAGEVLRLATLAAAQAHGQHGGAQVHDELKAMHGTMRDAYLKSTEAAWRAKFSRRDHR